MTSTVPGTLVPKIDTTRGDWLRVSAHRLARCSAFSDPFTGNAVAPHVIALSWFTALFEIAADVAFGVAGLQLLRAGQR